MYFVEFILIAAITVVCIYVFVYIELVKPIVETYGGEYLVRTDSVESWNELRKPDRCIVIRFPNREAIKNCFTSEQYKKIMSKRTEHVDSRAIIVPGMEEAYESISN